MKIFVIFAAFLALVSSQNLKYEKFELEIPENFNELIAKSRELRNSRLQNGNVVGSDTEWPFVVELTITMGENIFACTGSIINVNFLLSARNCVV
jgi:hypothetical protein